jgi:spore coat assembly protein
MELQVGDLVTRNSHHNDLVFIVTKIEDDIYYLKGLNIRLYADSPKSDLKKHVKKADKEEERFLQRIEHAEPLERSDYFYLPGKILHIDSDEDYLNRCLDYYKKHNIWAFGVKMSELEVSTNIKKLLDEYNPSIIVITGHDAYYQKKGRVDDLSAYKNSSNFADAIREARKIEKSHDKLIIISGACQSNYEELIRAGANFASSPKRINIHALDPAIIATRMSLSDVGHDIDLKGILENTKYGKDGIGGVLTKGTMYIGYPR